MNYQPYPGGLTSFSSEPLVKRRRGRPRKEENQSYAAKLSPIKPPPALGNQFLIIKQTNESQSSIPPFQPQVDLSKGKSQVDDVNASGGVIKDDEMIGQVVTGVLEGMFDAGYFLSVKVGESDTKLRGIVFEPGKFVPVTTENDVAPLAMMYSRIDVPLPVLNSPAQAYDSSSSKLVESTDANNIQVVGVAVEPGSSILQSTLEKNEGELAESRREEGKGVELEADKELDPVVTEPEQIMVEKSSIVSMGCESDVVKDVQEKGLEVQAEKDSEKIIIEGPSEAVTEGEGFVGKEAEAKFENVVIEAGVKREDFAEVDEEHLANPKYNDEVEELETASIGSQKVVDAGYLNERFGSPQLELALSSNTYDIQVPIDLSKPAVEKNLELDEDQQNIPQQNLDCLRSSSVMKDVLKISIDADEGDKTHVKAFYQSSEDVARETSQR